MTDLTQAIVDLQADMGGRAYGLRGPNDYERIILNAAASGEFIPKADARLAVAEAYRRAADEVRGSNLGLDIDDIADDVLALADTDALAEVQALRAERDQLRRMVQVTDTICAELAATQAKLARVVDALESIATFDPEVLDVKGQLIAAQDIARAALEGAKP